MNPNTQRPAHGGYPSAPAKPANAPCAFDPENDLREGVTPEQHRLLDALDELEELGLPATAWANAIGERLKQVQKFNHTPEEDDSLPIFALPQRAHEFTQIATDCLRGSKERQDVPRAHKKLIAAAALCIAAAERLQRTGRISA